MATWDLDGTKHHILICNGGSCMKHNGEEVTQAIREKIAHLGMDTLIHTTRTRCNGRCEDACIVIHYPEGVWYKDMNAEKGEQLINRIVNGEVVSDSDVMYTYQGGQFLSTSRATKGVSKIKSP